MNVPIWVAELAADFWRDAGDAERFPREMKDAIPRALPLSVLVIADLSLGRIQQRLADSGVVCDVGTRDRKLRGGLIGRDGRGIAFVDGTDSLDEQRFTLAHELAHFLKEYWLPRRQVEARLGPAALDILDGLRLPSTGERLQALLRFAPMGFHIHLLERDLQGDPASAEITAAEDDADRLAYELLAPAVRLLTHDCATLENVLVGTFGFPRKHAARYAMRLNPPAPPMDPLLRQLRIFS